METKEELLKELEDIKKLPFLSPDDLDRAREIEKILNGGFELSVGKFKKSKRVTNFSKDRG